VKQPVISLLSDDEKENGNAVETDPLSNPYAKITSTLTALSVEQASHDFPSTPAGRLALPDLIGMGDVRRVVHDISPEDRIEWDLRSSSSQLGIRRATKRARSSSPLSSPAAQAAAHFNSKGESLDTQIDSGSELWGRYSLNGSAAPTPQGATIPALVNIMFTSSPQNSKTETPRSGIFRRTNSCGNSFPKRRRIGSSQKEDVLTESAKIGPSKLSVLIERVQEGLRKPISTPEEQPLSHRVEEIDHRNSRDSNSPFQLDHEINNGTALYTPQQNREPAEKAGSDYGDIDDDDLDEASLFTCFPSKQEKPILSHPTESRLSSLPKAKQPSHISRYYTADTKQPSSQANFQKIPKAIPQIKMMEDEEFDDSDEDLYAAGLDDMVSSFCKSNAPSTTLAESQSRSNSSLLQKVAQVEDSDDEFGDEELDIIDFQVAELAATQSIQQTSNSVLPVRTKYP